MHFRASILLVVFLVLYPSLSLATKSLLHLKVKGDHSFVTAKKQKNRHLGNTTIHSFRVAKHSLEDIYADTPVSFYCGCDYGSNFSVDFVNCGFQPSRLSSRSYRIEWEHIVPAYAFGRFFPEWTKGDESCVKIYNENTKDYFRGRRCVRRVSAAFNYMEADLYNLVPVIGEVNALRSNYEMANIADAPYRFGQCKTKIKDRKIEPRPIVRGDIARIYFYMDYSYPGYHIINDKNYELLLSWHQQDPVDYIERQRAAYICNIQGNANPFVDTSCLQQD